MILFVYWIICGFVVFTLTNPTVTLFTFGRDNLKELFESLLLGGVIIPTLVIVFFVYWLRGKLE